MKTLRNCVWLIAALLAAGPALPAFQSDQAAGASTKAGKSATESTAKAKSTGSAQRSMPTVSDTDIATAKAAGKVWVNTETGVYHKGGRWYGATKQGKFMTEEDALRAGYRSSKNKQ